MSLYKVKATFTTSSLSYHPTALQNTLKYDGLSNAVAGKNNSDILDLNGTLSSTAKGSGFSTPQIIAITVLVMTKQLTSHLCRSLPVMVQPQ